MARTYSQFVSLVRDWSNKDSEVLSDSIIKDALRYAADKAYRKLRVSALETTVTYSSTALTAATTAGSGLVPSMTELAVPTDLIEFIQVREVDSLDRTTRLFNEKTDLRTFNDVYGEKHSNAYWSRQGTNLILSPGFQDSGSVGNPDKVEIHYYKRLAALDAKYDITVANYNAGFLESASQGDTGAESLWIVGSGSSAVAYATQDDVPDGDTATETWFTGKEAYNWLRDDNERILLMGALTECFMYLQDDVQARKYGEMFVQEIDELNDEDNKRNASGGNVQMHFNGRGLI